MILYFKANGVTYETIDSNELSIQQYLNILDIIDNNVDDLLELSKELFAEITNLPHESIMDLNDYTLAIIDWGYYIKDLKNLNKIKKEYGNYQLKDLNVLGFGNYIDLDYFLIQNNKNRIIDVVGLMLLSSDYKLSDLNKSKEYVMNMKTKDVITIYNYFTTYRLNIFKQFESLFDEPNEDDDEEYTEEQLEELRKEEELKADEKVYSNWLETAYMLTNKDITKNDIILGKPFLEVLNYLTWLKAENDKEIQRTKNSYR